MEGFQDLFTNFDSQDSYTILAIMFIALLFGMLIGFLLRAPRIRGLKKDLKESERKLGEAQAETEQLRTQQTELAKKLKQTEYNLVAYNEKVEVLEKEKAKLLKDVYLVNQQVEEVQSANRTFNATIESLENQIIGLKAKNEQLAKEVEEVDDGVNNVAQMQSLYNATRQQLEAFEARLTHLDQENTSLESRLTHLDQENDLLKAELFTLKTAQAQVVTAPPPPKAEEPLLSFVEEGTPEPDLESLLHKDKPVLSEKIVIEEHEKDDLSLINGVGPFIEKKLNDIGIYTYLQISQFDAEKIQQVTRDVAYFPGRIEKDDWVGQATKLHQLKLNSPDGLKKKVTHPIDAGDLKVIEGIGPKIEQLLKDENINNWQDLSETSVERLQEILTAAGERYRIHDPSTWANQARLAVEQRWEELAQYQDELKGGRVV
ncbi:MAG: hypothetical protein R2828_16770 [Saprospiraceae bacterium]